MIIGSREQVLNEDGTPISPRFTEWFDNEQATPNGLQFIHVDLAIQPKTIDDIKKILDGLVDMEEAIERGDTLPHLEEITDRLM